MRPIETIPREGTRPLTVDHQKGAKAVVLDLLKPSRAFWRLVNESGQLAAE
jgi:hypothetical protein